MRRTDDDSATPDRSGELPAWSAYQEEVAEFFRGLGLTAKTNVRIDGARGVHDVDVLVEFASAGLPIRWIVECKAWKRAIPKERVMVLAGVVEDVGADRGLIVAESGFQGGAVRVGQYSNITLTSLDDLRANTEVERAQSEVSGLAGRIGALHADSQRLWGLAPPSTPGGSIPVGRMVDFAADVFELHSMVLPKIASCSYPIVLTMGGHVLAADAAQLKPALIQRVEGAEQEAEALWVLASSTSQRAAGLLDALRANVAELLKAGRDLDEDIATPVEETPRFVVAMRTVGDSAEVLKPLLPTRARSELVTLMRWLLERTYVITAESRPDWDSEQQHLAGFLAAIRAELEASSNRDKAPSAEQSN